MIISKDEEKHLANINKFSKQNTSEKQEQKGAFLTW